MDTRVTADDFYAVFLNMLQYFADNEGNGEINWDMTVFEFAELLEQYPLNFTIEHEQGDEN